MKLLKIPMLIMLFLFSVQAVAHSKLINSQPADGAVLKEAPKQITLEFNRKVRLMKLEVHQDGSDTVKTEFKPILEKLTLFSVDLPELTAGSYQVKWVAMSGDSHKMKGEFSFSLSATLSEVDNTNSTETETQGKDIVTPDETDKVVNPDAAENKIDHHSPVSVVNGFTRALQRNNAKLLKMIVEPEVIIFEEGGVEASFAEYAAGHLKSDMAFMSKIDRTIKSQQVIEDTKLATVITSSEVRNKTGVGALALHNRVLETMVLKKTTAGWKIIHIHWSSQKM